MSAGVSPFFFSCRLLNLVMNGTGGSSRGDLGFIANTRYPNPNRMFYGSVGNLSKKGVALFSQTSKVNMESPGSKPSELTAESMVVKRTDYLEKQERKLTATVTEHRSEQQRMAEQLAASLGNLDILNEATKRVSCEQEKMSLRTKQLAQDQHWVYGKTSRVLKGIEAGDKIHSTLETYRKNKGVADELVDLSPAGKWVFLSYPMERVDTENGFQYLMKVRLVEARTGQISVCWAIVFEEVNDTQHFAIEEFATWPH